MAGETRMAFNWRGIAKTGLAYGGGLMAGNIVSQVLFGVLSPEPYGMLGEAARLLIGILMVMLITGLGGALGGFLGGWTLPVTGEPKGKYGYAWRSAISLGIVYGTFLLLIVFALSALTLRDAAFMPAGPFMKVYLFIGLISGALIGLLLGLTTVGWRRTGSVIIASIVGFSFGGVAFGAGVWAYMRSAPAGGIREGNHVLLLLALFGFGLFGGLAIGFAFDRFARKDKGHRLSPMGPWMRYSLIVLAVLFALWLLVQLRPALAFAADMLTPRAAMQTETIASDSAGSHWQESSEVTTAASEIAALDLSVGESSDLALVWSEVIGDAREVQLQAGTSSADGGTDWAASTNVSHSATDSQYPSVFVDAEGVAHVAWLEGDSGIAHYSRCLDGDCTDAAPLADVADACPSGGGRPDTLSIEVAASHDGTVMVVWSDPKGGLHYRILPDGTQGCVPSPRGSTMGSFSLDGGPSSGFSMALDDSQGSIWLTAFEDAGWDSTAVELGAGVRPDLLVAENGSPFVVWCAGEGGVAFWSEGQSEVISSFSCQGGPSVAVDGEGRAHVVWQSDQVEDVLGEVRREDVLHETIGDGDSWGEPMIVARLERSADHGLADGPAGDLHLAWTGIDPAIQYARQQSYECDSETLSGAEAELYEVARMGGYRPEGDVIPFCQNQYQMMLFTPTVDPSFSAADPTLNGGYDDYAELLQTADYEALFTTMAYEKAVNQDSPGAVLARGVMDLYEKVKANPEDYPRGMLVRILLGNSPSPSFELLELDGGLWYVLNDLQEAGLEKMIDPEVGWRVEVANFAGRWPHSHVKTMIVDGKTVVASGFNHEYKPLSKDHPSGKGLGDTDTGLVITGPVAQHSRLIYDQLWTGAIQRHCPDLSASEVELRLTCEDSRGVPDHVPEVMRYWLTDNEAIAFSMFRNRIYDEADQQLLEAYGAAQQSIDLAQAMFSMPLICNLNHFFEVCNFDQALPYMEALMDAADQGARVRILLTPYPIQNVENVIAMEIFNKEAIERGLAHSVEIRMLDDLLHSKSALIDGEFVIVGSQNLHWSAFGVDNGLSEYSLGAGDPGAAEQYQRFFDYLWERAPSHAETAN